MEDKLLKQKEGAPVELAETQEYFSLGLKYADLTDKDVSIFSGFFHDLYMATGNKHSLDISRNPFLHIHGSLFALGSSTNELNKDWRGHTASSLREMLYIWNDHSFFACFKLLFENFDQLDDPSKKQIEANCKRIKSFYGYFSGVTHQNSNGVTFKYSELEGAHTKSYDECITKELFVEMVAKFYREVKILISFLPDEKKKSYEPN